MEAALDRFAQFFISPTISQDGVEREVKAVDSECAAAQPRCTLSMSEPARTLASTLRASLEFRV